MKNNHQTIITAQPVYGRKGRIVSATIKVQSNMMEPNTKYLVTIQKVEDEISGTEK